MLTVKLADGCEAVLKDPESVSNGERKRAQAAYDRASGAGPMSREYALMDELLKVMVSTWTLQMPVPADDPAVLDQLSMDDANTLYESLRPVLARIFPDFSPTPDPLVRTERSPV